MLKYTPLILYLERSETLSKRIQYDIALVRKILSEIGLTLLSTEYKNMHDDLLIECRCGKPFTRNLKYILYRKRYWCLDCYNGRDGKHHIDSHEEFLEKVKKIHGDNYSFLTQYNGRKNDILVKCNKCDSEPFYKKAQSYLKENQYTDGCDSCTNRKLNIKKTHEQFVKEVYELVGDEYTVLSEYTNCREKVVIRHNCDKCSNNEYLISPTKFLYAKRRCPVCISSLGEKEIYDWCVNNKVDFIYQHTFEDCRNVFELEYDFFIPNKNISIEYQGKQHYEAVDWFGGEESFKKQQYRDDIKRKYCKDNGIFLLEIPYTDFDFIDDILEKYLL